MREDTVAFAIDNEASTKRPKFVIEIEYDVDSIFLTSHTGITDVPGVVIENVLRRPSATSQRIVPDEGRSEIGSFSFSLVDLDSAFTEQVRANLGDGEGLRGKTVRFWLGYSSPSFDDFQLFQTQIVVDADYDKAIYTIDCADITREQRTDIFEPKTTTLRDSITESSTTIPVYSTTGFSTVKHGASYSDAPSATVGYAIVDKEWVRYTGKTADTFTGCTRGVLNTKAVPHNVDAGSDAERRPKVEEGIYLELPAVKLALAILTGELYGDSASLPDHWNLGIDPSLVRESDFTGIGADLWDTTLDSAAFVTRFQGLSKTDGKKFLESELYMLLGCFSPIYSDGTIGLKRMNQVLRDAAYIVELNSTNIVSHSALQHDLSGMHNRLQIEWNWNGERFTRSTLFVDAQSISRHGPAPLKKLQFKGLHGSRHTEAVIRKRLDAFRDRYTAPPQLTTIKVLPSLNRLEVGDIVRDRLAGVRDFAGNSQNIDRSFEIQRRSADYVSGDVTLELFGSTAAASVVAPNSSPSGALPDAFYTSAGTNLTSATTISVVGGVGIIQPGTYNLAAGIYYYNGDLELSNGATLTINGTVTIRHKGFFTINGHINGKGRGKAGQADTSGWMSTVQGLPGFLGNSRGMDGVILSAIPRGGAYFYTQPAALTQGQYSAFPFLDLSVSGNNLLGVPTDLAGTSGGAGGKYEFTTATGFGKPLNVGTVVALGGSGANSGAGLALIGRGLAFGASGAIDISGNDSAPTPLTNSTYYPGAGGAGCPGALLVLLDGSGISIPDLGGKFTAACGTVPINGTPMPDRILGPGLVSHPEWVPPKAGYLDESLVSGVDLSNVAYRIQYLADEETAQPDQGTKPPPVTAITTESVETGINVYMTLPDVTLIDTVVAYASIDNDRTHAVKIAEGMLDFVRYRVPDGVSRYFWTRTKLDDVFSDYFPVSSTGGIVGSSIGGFIARGNCEVYGSGARKNGGTNAYDSDVYSLETYASGCFVSFQANQTDASILLGLNSDPTTDQNYTSVDYAWLVADDGNAYIFESGVDALGSLGTYTTTNIFSIKYDGQNVQYFKDSTLKRSVPLRDGTFFLDSSFKKPGGSVKGLKFGPLTTAPSIPFVAAGNCVATATTAQKLGGSSAWDSHVYSFEGYREGSFASFQPNQANAALMMGLNTDPLTDQSYTSIDHAWYVLANGTYDIYESNVDTGVTGSYSAGDIFAIAYDGKVVRYLKNGALIRSVPDPGKTFYLDSSFFSPGGSVRNLTFSAYGSATPVPFLARGNCVVHDTSAQKVGGSSAWDSDIISINGFATAHLSFKASQTDKAVMVGMNADPYTDSDYASIDGAWYCASDGTLRIYEGGSDTAAISSAYTTATLLEITYDGSNLRYYKDTVLVRTHSYSATPVFLDSAFYTAGGAINSIAFGPGTALDRQDTGQIGVEAATEVNVVTVASVTGIVTTYSGVFATGQVEDGYEIVVTATARFVMNITNAVPCELRGWISSGGASAPASTDLLASNTGNATANIKGSFSMEKTFIGLAAGSTSFYLNVQPVFSAPAHVASTVDLYDIVVKAEVIKR